MNVIITTEYKETASRVSSVETVSYSILSNSADVFLSSHIAIRIVRGSQRISSSPMIVIAW